MREREVGERSEGVKEEREGRERGERLWIEFWTFFNNCGRGT